MLVFTLKETGGLNHIIFLLVFLFSLLLVFPLLSLLLYFSSSLKPLLLIACSYVLLAASKISWLHEISVISDWSKAQLSKDEYRIRPNHYQGFKNLVNISLISWIRLIFSGLKKRQIGQNIEQQQQRIEAWSQQATRRGYSILTIYEYTLEPHTKLFRHTAKLSNIPRSRACSKQVKKGNITIQTILCNRIKCLF